MGKLSWAISHTIPKNHFHVGWKGKCETVKFLEDTIEYLDDLKVKEKRFFRQDMHKEKETPLTINEKIDNFHCIKTKNL